MGYYTWKYFLSFIFKSFPCCLNIPHKPALIILPRWPGAPDWPLAPGPPSCPPLWPSNNIQTHQWNPLSPFLVYSNLTHQQKALTHRSLYSPLGSTPAWLNLIPPGTKWLYLSRSYEYNKLCFPVPLLWSPLMAASDWTSHKRTQDKPRNP